MIDPEEDVRPRIVGDFNFGGIDYIVVYWPEQDFVAPSGEIIDHQPEAFQFYRANVAWPWLVDAVDVRQNNWSRPASDPVRDIQEFARRSRL